jgi:hypothetical protein
MAWPNQKIKSWKEFTDIVDKYLDRGPLDDDGFCLFRGQSNAEWSLQPSIARALGGLRADKVHDAEKSALDLFRKQAHRFIDLRGIRNQEDPLEWWPHMQHYKAPTRLLDWTASPYVAAYFAVAGHREVSGAVWFVGSSVNLWNKMEEQYPLGKVLDANNYLRLSDRHLFGKLPPRIFVMYKAYDDSRMFAQQGHYTFCLKPLADQGAEIERVYGKTSDIGLYGQYLIPPHLKPEFFKQLYLMNISANSLFPGLDGIGLSIAEAMTLQADRWPRAQTSVPGSEKKDTHRNTESRGRFRSHRPIS